MNEIEYTYLIFVWILLIMCELHFLLSFCAGRKSSSESLQCVVWSSGHVHCDLLRLECVSVYLKWQHFLNPVYLSAKSVTFFLSIYVFYFYFSFIPFSHATTTLNIHVDMNQTYHYKHPIWCCDAADLISGGLKQMKHKHLTLMTLFQGYSMNILGQDEIKRVGCSLYT